MMPIPMSRHFKKLSVFVIFFCFIYASISSAQSDDWWNNIENDRRSKVMEELALGMDPNVKTREGQPAIMMAIQQQSWSVYDLLRQHRHIDLNAINAHDETPLMYLAVLGETQRAQELIKQGALVRRLGWTPLHYAASKGHTDTAQLLLKEGALVNSPAPDGTSPLMMAALSGERSTVDLLLNAGADVNAVNLQQLNAADWARSKNNTQLANYLDNYEKAMHTPAKDPAFNPESSARSNSQTNEDNNSSRYFDLNRFDEPVVP